MKSQKKTFSVPKKTAADSHTTSDRDNTSIGTASLAKTQNDTDDHKSGSDRERDMKIDVIDHEHNTEEVKQPKKERKKKQTAHARSLTDEEYSELFKSVIEKALQDSAKPENEMEETCKTRSENDSKNVFDKQSFKESTQQSSILVPCERANSNDDKDDLDSIKSDEVDSWSDGISKENIVDDKHQQSFESKLAGQQKSKSKIAIKTKYTPAQKTNGNGEKQKMQKQQDNADNKENAILKTKRKKNANAEKLSKGLKKKKKAQVSNGTFTNPDNEPESSEDEEKGTWIQCSKQLCGKWRYVAGIDDPVLVPVNWECKMNPDEDHNSCDLPEVDYDESEHICTTYTIGSVVWAKMDGYPWWPGMIEADPDYDLYFELLTEKSMVPYQYHVTFFDDHVTRAWIRTAFITSYIKGSEPKMKTSKGQAAYKREIQQAVTNAEKALGLPLKERISMFGFSKRYNKNSKWSTKGVKQPKSKPFNKDRKKDSSAPERLESESSLDHMDIEDVDEYKPVKTKSRGTSNFADLQENKCSSQEGITVENKCAEDSNESVKDKDSTDEADLCVSSNQQEFEFDSLVCKIDVDGMSKFQGQRAEASCSKDDMKENDQLDPSLDTSEANGKGCASSDKIEIDKRKGERNISMIHEEYKDKDAGEKAKKRRVKENHKNAGLVKKAEKNKEDSTNMNNVKVNKVSKSCTVSEKKKNNDVKITKKSEKGKDNDVEITKKKGYKKSVQNILQSNNAYEQTQTTIDCVNISNSVEKSTKNNSKKETKGKGKSSDDHNVDKPELFKNKRCGSATSAAKKFKSVFKPVSLIQATEKGNDTDHCKEPKSFSVGQVFKGTKRKDCDESDEDSDKENTEPCSDSYKTNHKETEKRIMYLEKEPRNQHCKDGQTSKKQRLSGKDVTEKGTGSIVNSEDEHQMSVEQNTEQKAVCSKTKKKKMKVFSAPRVSLTVDTDRQVPQLSSNSKKGKNQKIELKAKKTTLERNDQHVPDIASESEKVINSINDVEELHSQEQYLAKDLELEEEEELDLNFEEHKESTKIICNLHKNFIDTNDSEDEDQLDLDVDLRNDKVIVEKISDKQEILGRFAGSCADHGSDSDPLELIED